MEVKPFGRIIWHDAHTSTDQYTEHEIEHLPTVAETFGYIIRSDNIGVTLAGEKVGGSYRNVTFVPRMMIVKEEILRLSPIRKKKDAPPPTT